MDYKMVQPENKSMFCSNKLDSHYRGKQRRSKQVTSIPSEVVTNENNLTMTEVASRSVSKQIAKKDVSDFFAECHTKIVL